MAMAMAPGLSAIYVYESPYGPADDMISRMATDGLAKQMSSSWGYGGDATTDSLLKEMAAQGISFYQASGDRGAFNGPLGPGNFGAESGESPYFTLVGGTELVMNGLGVGYNSESVWGTGEYVEDSNWGSSGGIGTSYNIPSYQLGISMTLNQGSTTYRNSPDVSLTADNVYTTFFDGYYGSSAGTSAAAPLWAGYTAVINEQATQYGHPTIGFINPAVYAIGKGSNYLTYFHDITVGNNTWPDSPTNFYAVAGYDLCTGWGTPTGSNFINYMAPPVAIPVLEVVTNVLTGGNGNGVIDFNECNNLTFLITNAGVATATHVQGFLYSTTLDAIVGQSTVNFPDLPPHTAARSTTPFTLSTETAFVCGTPIDLVLLLKSDEAIQTNDIELASGIVGVPNVFGSSNSYSLTGQGTIQDTVYVTNLASAAKITASVDISCLYDEGLELILTSPNGTAVTLTTYPVGGEGANFGIACGTNYETTFDDEASVSISSGTAPFVGRYQPLEPLSSFLPAIGTNLNGAWTLTANQLFSGNPTTLNCWSVNVTPYECSDGGGQCPGSDVSLNMTVQPNPAVVFSNVVYNMYVSNAGPSDATSIVISQALPPGFQFVTTSNYPAQVVQNGTNLSLTLGSLPVYGTTLVSVITIPTYPGLATSEATVGSTSSDPNPGNNSAVASTFVQLPAADLGVTMTATPTTVLQNGVITFTAVITNNGPATATGVTLTNFMPTNATFISATSSQGTISPDGQLAYINTLPPGTNAVYSVTLSPKTTGNFVDTVQVAVGAAQQDPVSLNNIASFTVTVGPSADVGVSAGVFPGTVVAGSNAVYVATVYNNGPNTASSVTFTQTIPGGTGLNAETYVSNSVGAGVVVTNGTITWNIGTMANGAQRTITNTLKTPVIASGGNPLNMASTFSVYSQPGDANTNNNVVIVSNIVAVPAVKIVPATATLVSQSGPTLNGAINPGEQVGVNFYLQNAGNIPTTNLVATLQATGGVTLPGGNPQTYGALVPGGAPVAGYFTFVANGTNGGTVVATLSLQDGSTSLGTAAFTFYLPEVHTFYNTNPIYLPATNFVPQPDAGPASPYPSSIIVSNVTGYLSKVTVTVSNMSHTYPHDIGLLLAGPSTNTVLMDSAAEGYSFMTDTTVTFDSTASIALPSSGSFTSGTYAPADYNATNAFVNAGAAPYGTNLTNFVGGNANGTWSLFGQDNAPGDSGGISNGWSLTITTITPVNPTNSLLAGITQSTNQLVVGDYISYYMAVTNAGITPVDAYITNTLPTALTFESVTGDLGGFVQNGQTVVYHVGVLGAGQGAVITNVDLAAGAGYLTNSINAGVAFAAFNLANNSASIVAAVSMPLADLAAGISATPTNAIVGSNITYTLTVTNLGPSNSVATVGKFSLAGLSVNLTNVIASQVNSNSFSNGFVVCDLGTIVPNGLASVTIVAVPTNVGTFSNTWSVISGSDDINPSNNLAAAVVTASAAIPVISAYDATLLSQGDGSVNSNVPVTVALTLTNSGFVATRNLMATLLASNSIAPITTNQVYGAIPAQGIGTEPFTFVADGAPGATVTATLMLNDGSNSYGTVSFAFVMPSTASFTNSGEIIIPQFGTATPYPAAILVTNVSGLVSKVTVTLKGFAHTFPHDVNALLASPSGQELIVMGHAGGPYGATNLTLTFDDAASASLPVGQLLSGTYLPTDYAPVDLFPGLPAATDGTSLALFNGYSPNGLWSLYVYDDTQGNGGAIVEGWSLGLTTVQTINPAALLQASMIAAPDPVYSGNYLNYQITVSNQGPSVANNVVITDALPASLTFITGSASQGSVSNLNGTVVAYLGSISNGAIATATIRVIANTPGTIENAATVSTASADLYLADATAVNSTTVLTSPSAQLLATNLSNGTLQLTLRGQEGQNYALESSTNLLQWTAFYTNEASLTNGSFTQVVPMTNSLKFYRATRLPQ